MKKKKKKLYQQCLLNNGNRFDTAWIETRGASRGNIVELLHDHSYWTVVEAYKTTLTEDELMKQQANARRGFASTKK